MKLLNVIRVAVGVIIMLGTYIVISDGQPWYYKSILFSIGFSIAFFPKLKKNVSWLLYKKIIVIGIAIISSYSASAKDYTKPTEVSTDGFEQNFETPILPYIIEKLLLANETNPVDVEFESLDGLLISGTLYEIDKDKPIILLCHQARFNRMEYADIAPKLNKLGFNCLAIDQRSGGDLRGEQNETFERAKKKGLNTNFISAEKDIEAAIKFLQKKYNRKVIVWGSSYSSSLALFLSAKNDAVKASISFSPGDYFGNDAETLTSTFLKIGKPFFVTSSKQEAARLSGLIDKSKLKENQVQFIPKLEGYHGSKALWEGQKGGEEYWTAITDFLKAVEGE